MNRRELVAAVAAATGQDSKSVDTTLRGFVDVTLVTVSKGEPVAISGFAKFAKVKRAARMGRNPATGEPVQIKASTKARITALKGFKDVVSGAAAPPKLTPVPAAKAAPAAKKSAKAAPAKKSSAKKAAKKSAAKKSAKKAPPRKAAKKSAKKARR